MRWQKAAVLLRRTRRSPRRVIPPGVSRAGTAVCRPYRSTHFAALPVPANGYLREMLTVDYFKVLRNAL